VAAARTAIEWTEATWNPITGCSKVSPGCAHCYAETLSLRFRYSALPWIPENAAKNVILHPDRLDQPLRWRRPRLVFVNSMSDLFHELVPFSFVSRVFDVMSECPRHTFQILTKRPERMLEYARSTDVAVLSNVWLGVSIENSRFTWRAETLKEVPAAVRFVSAEPLLGSLFESGSRRAPLNVGGLDWVIAGGESGPAARPVDIGWARELRDVCAAIGVPFFFKQWGGRTPKAGGRELDDRLHDAMPRAASG
jgi:protein gp37